MFTTIQWWAKHNFHSITSNLEADYNGPKVFNINAPVGCGKTILINAILAYARGQGNKCISVASSGIAATLLNGGRTTHSIFGIPIPNIFEIHQHVQ